MDQVIVPDGAFVEIGGVKLTGSLNFDCGVFRLGSLFEDSRINGRDLGKRQHCFPGEPRPPGHPAVPERASSSGGSSVPFGQRDGAGAMLNRREFAGMFAAAAVVRRRGPDRSAPATDRRPAKEPNLARMLRTKKLRLAAFSGEEPYCFKSASGGEWSGFCIAMARNLASELGVELAIDRDELGRIGNRPQRRQARLGLCSDARPRNARCSPISPIRCSTTLMPSSRAKALRAKSWAEINTPGTLVAAETGSPREEAARRFAGNAAITGFKTRDEAHAGGSIRPRRLPGRDGLPRRSPR